MNEPRRHPEQGGGGEPEPKIIIDSDWKQQAQKEKAKLAEAEQAAKPQDQEQRPIGMDDIIRMFATQALMYLGAFPDPETGKAVLAPEMARVSIDMLGVLDEKTAGNLTDEESQALKGILHDLRLQYVEINKAVEQAIAEGKIKPQQMGGMGGGLGGAMPGGPSGPGPVVGG